MKQRRNFSGPVLVGVLVALFAAAGFSFDPPAPRAAVRSAPTMMEENISLLPASDAIAVVDVARIMNDLIPQLRAISPETAGKVQKEVTDFTNETGIDPTKIKSAIIGLSLSGKNTAGAAILDGVTFDPARLTAALTKEKKSEVKTIEYKGKPIYTIVSKELGKAGAKAGVGVEEEMALTQLSADRAAVGTLSGVKGVLDGGSGSANAALSSILSKTNTGLLRFAVTLPESAKQGLAGQGDLFKQFATIKTIFGSFDLTGDLSAVLDAKMRTNTNEEASQLQTSLAGLVGMGKMFLGGNNDPQMQALNELLDLIKIGAQDTDVSLSMTVPRKVFDLFVEKSRKKAN